MSTQKTTVHQLPFRYYFILVPLAVFVKLWLFTLRFKYSKETLENVNKAESFVTLLWHNRLFITPKLKTHFIPNKKLSALISPSKDGAWSAALFRLFGVGAIRGSSKRRGVASAIELVRTIQKGENIFLTPDGPRGPKYHIKKGALFVSEASGAPIMLVRAKYRYCITFNSWDNFMLPLPFSSVNLEVSPPATYKQFAEKAAAENMPVEKYFEKCLGD